ncbi:MAG: phosphate ABC transporter permease PstA [Oscillochloris sp.]|nr:phosphate ABC transporter permease PstA [Oscillochloris sp.]
MTTLQTTMPNYGRRRIVDLLMRGFTVTATGLAIIPLVLIIGYVLVVGGGAMSVDFFTKTYEPPVAVDAGSGGIDPTTGLPLDFALPGAETDATSAPTAQGIDPSNVQARGGVIHGIVGTLMVTLIALLISLPIGILAGIFLSEYPDNLLATFIRFCSDVLSGAPSIVIGVVGYVLLVRTTKTYSGIAGSAALTFLMVPTITRTTEEILKLVPNAVREAAMAMGAPTWYGTLTVVVPTALSGIVTGALLAFARGAGETAPLLLTIQGNSNLSFNLLQPIAALPLLTYRYIESPFPAENQLAWGTAFVLMMLVLLVNLAVRLVTNRLKGGA